MRIIIYHQVCPALAEEAKWHYSCSSSHRLLQLLDDNPGADVEGYIAKDAHENSDFKEMMDLIYIRKKKLYENNRKKYPNSVKIHDVFAEKILVEFQKFYTP